jgi:hypothetical protein
MKDTNRRHPAARLRAAAGICIAAALALLASCQTMGSSGPYITVSDQRLNSDRVAVGRVVSEGPGWLVIHGDSGGAPGPVLGWVPVKAGTNWNLRARIDSARATPYLWAMLHVDAGTEGQYEFPGPDAPTTVDGRIVMERFKLNEGYTGTGGTGGMGGM